MAALHAGLVGTRVRYGGQIGTVRVVTETAILIEPEGTAGTLLAVPIPAHLRG